MHWWFASLQRQQSKPPRRAGWDKEHPYAAHHIEGLPADVRRAVVTHEHACGGKAAAAGSVAALCGGFVVHPTYREIGGEVGMYGRTVQRILDRA